MRQLIAAFLTLILTATAMAEELVLVTGPTSPVVSITSQDILRLYTGKSSTTYRGQSITIYDLEDEQLRRHFYKSVLSKSLMQVRALRAKLVFTGRGRPPEQVNTQELIERLKKGDAAIGYIPASKAGELRILHEFSESAQSASKLSVASVADASLD